MPKSRKPTPKPAPKSSALAEQLQRVIDRVQAGIAEHGWFAISTMGGRKGDPDYTYTVGMQASFSVPDVIILGLDVETARSYLHHAAKLAKTPGAALKAGHLPGFFSDFDGWALAVEEKHFLERFKVSRTLYPGKVDALQLVFPDAQGRFPWDARSTYHGKVPLLGQAPRLS